VKGRFEGQVGMGTSFGRARDLLHQENLPHGKANGGSRDSCFFGFFARFVLFPAEKNSASKRIPVPTQTDFRHFPAENDPQDALRARSAPLPRDQARRCRLAAFSTRVMERHPGVRYTMVAALVSEMELVA